jgi:hypothetical protein
MLGLIIATISLKPVINRKPGNKTNLKARKVIIMKKT